jgi:hypothetical protein
MEITNITDFINQNKIKKNINYNCIDNGDNTNIDNGDIDNGDNGDIDNGDIDNGDNGDIDNDDIDNDDIDNGDIDNGDIDNGDIDNESSDNGENQSIDENKKIHLYYDEHTDCRYEHISAGYHKQKDFGDWYLAKTIILDSTDNKSATEYFLDYLDIQMQANNDNFDNIIKVYYKNEIDDNNSNIHQHYNCDIVYEFDEIIGKYLVDNLKVPEYKPKGYIFNNENQNKWLFKIVVLTQNNIYSANRYITDSIIGFY